MLYFSSQKTGMHLGFLAWWRCLSHFWFLLLPILLFQGVLDWCCCLFTSDGLRKSTEVLIITKRVVSHLSWDGNAIIASHNWLSSLDIFNEGIKYQSAIWKRGEDKVKGNSRVSFSSSCLKSLQSPVPIGPSKD